MHKTIKDILLIIILSAISAAYAQPDETDAIDRKLDIHQVLKWFSPTSQSVLVTNGPYVLPNLSKLEELRAEQSVPMLATVPAVEIASKRFYPLFTGHQIDWGVEVLGRPINQTKMHLGFYILRFSSLDEWTQIRALIEKKCDARIKEHEVDEFEFDEPSEFFTAGEVKLYLAFPVPNVIMISPELGGIRTVLLQRKFLNCSGPLLQNLEEWKYVDEHSKFWALRHFTKSQSELKLNDPARSPDKGAVGIVYSYDPRSEKIKMTYLNELRDEGLLHRLSLGSYKNQCVMKRLAPNALELEINEKAVGCFPLIIYASLGHWIPGGL